MFHCMVKNTELTLVLLSLPDCSIEEKVLITKTSKIKLLQINVPKNSMVATKKEN